MSIEKSHASIRVIHWIMFILFGIMFVLGVVMVEFKESEPWAMYSFHKATGVLLFLLVWLRLMLRWKTQVPPPSAEIKPQEHRIAQSVVHLLYLFMIIVPITGYALSNIHGYDVNFYGLPLPKLFPTVAEWENITSLLHEYLAYTFLGIITLHLLGIIKHHVKGQEVLRRIT
ncbi:MAG: cytochrome b/b6 domain-containing protein [Pseudomonadota bacterium]